jgi:hypothetical protein
MPCNPATAAAGGAHVSVGLVLWLAPRNRISSDNLSRMTRVSGILGRIERVEYGFFPAEIPAIEFAVKKYHPMPAAAGLPHFEFQEKHCSNRFYVSWGQISR